MTGAQMDAMQDAEDRKAYEAQFLTDKQQQAFDAVKYAEDALSKAVDTLQIAAGECEAEQMPGWAQVVSIFGSAQDLATELLRVANRMERGG